MSGVEVEWLASYTDGDVVRFRIGRTTDATTLVAEWIGLAELRVARDGRDPVFVHSEGAYLPDIDKIRRGSVQLLLRSLAGLLSMHGAAIAVSGAAVVLLGRGGQGKSTLAAKLGALGASLLSDDAVGIAAASLGYCIEPLERNHWLDASALQALGHAPEGDWKAARPALHPAEESASLLAFVDLAFDAEAPEPRLEGPFSGIAALQAVVPQVVRFILDDNERNVRELEQLVLLLERVPVYRLVRPRGFEYLDAAAQRILDLLRKKG